jgi:hypothetical protein
VDHLLVLDLWLDSRLEDNMRSELRRGMPNTTTQTGTRVHEADRGGYPICGYFVHGIWYTDEPVNCEKCIREKAES